jgi:hypothetical protein
MTYFAYIHCRPETVNQSGVFYVGKGKESRSKDLTARNRYHGFIVKKYGKANIMIGRLDCSSEEISFELEKGLIKCLKRNGVELTNQTDGGDGSSGFKYSEEMKQKMSVSAKEVGSRPEVKLAKSIATKRLNAERWSNPEWVAKTKAAMKGKKKTQSEASNLARKENGMKSRTQEANAKKSEAAIKMWSDPDFRKRMSEIKRTKLKE